VVKPTIERGFDYHSIKWLNEDGDDWAPTRSAIMADSVTAD
jgi:hypothetical protein